MMKLLAAVSLVFASVLGVKQLSEGDKCGLDIDWVTGKTRCGQGLYCLNNTCITGPCQLALNKLDGSSLLGVSKPKCDTDGTYSAKQCNGGGCYCVAKNGADLGYFTQYGPLEEKMTCDCARDMPYSTDGVTGVTQKLMPCDDQGNFNFSR